MEDHVPLQKMGDLFVASSRSTPGVCNMSLMWQKREPFQKKNGLSSNHVFCCTRKPLCFSVEVSHPQNHLEICDAPETMRIWNPSGSPEKLWPPKMMVCGNMVMEFPRSYDLPNGGFKHDVFNGDESQSQGMKNPQQKSTLNKTYPRALRKPNCLIVP